VTDDAARRLVLIPLSRIRHGSLTVIEEGRRRTFGSGAPSAVITVHSPTTWRSFLRGSLGMADAYADALWDSPDLVALIRLAARNAAVLDRFRATLAPALIPLQRLRALPRRSNRRRRRRDISAHYDLGEELFMRMLDPTLTYSCAVFPRRQATLEEAQRMKLELVCSKLELGPGDRVLEIGTGWGSFALHAAATRGCEVTTTTISSQQYEHAVRKVREAGLEDRISVLKTDYRDLRGRYDKLVSIEMIEAVGWRHTGTLFAGCSDLLEPEGAMLLQAITIDDRAYEVEKDSRSFIKERIFPGGSLPSVESMSRDLARRTDLQVVGLEDLTAHYVPTLRRWRENLAANSGALTELGYDDQFQRLWTLYLAYCEAGFAERRICDLQLLLAKPRSRLGSLDWGRHAIRPPAHHAEGHSSQQAN
jgi:cyclopropane-fatty-acyl-phospholipid synthase